jgi:DNA polymerase III subunit beta
MNSDIAGTDISSPDISAPGAAAELRVTCTRDALASALGVVARALSSRSAVQVLTGIHLQAEDGKLVLAATDMEVSLRASLEGTIAGDGAVVAPGRLLADLVRLLPDDSVSLAYEEGDGVLEVTSGSYASKVNVFSAEDFPRLPLLDVALHTIDASALLGTIDKVARAASRDESRPVLTGILVRFEGDKLTMAATDSYRLSVKETTLGESGPELDAIIPARALQELSRLAAGAETVSLGVHENHVIFGIGDVWLTSRRIDGQFPNYSQLLPETFEAEVSIERVPLLEVVRRASIMAQRNSPLRLRFADGELSISAQTQDVGEARESLEIEYSSDPLEIGFNPEFLRDGLEAVGGDTIQLRLINPLRPGLIAAPDESFWYLIMPIRLAG